MKNISAKSFVKLMHNCTVCFSDMEKSILIFALVIGLSAKGQSLKDALFGGKLKSDTGMVLKKGDSLQLLPDSLVKKRADSLKKAAKISESIKTNPSQSISENTSDTASYSTASNAPKNNDQLWKQFIDEYKKVIETDVLPSKKIKKGSYSLYIDYGSVSTVNIICVPENSYLVEQV